MWTALVWTSIKNEWNAQNAVWSCWFWPSTPGNMITRVLTICHEKPTQSTHSVCVRAKAFDIRSLSPSLRNLSLLLVHVQLTVLILFWCSCTKGIWGSTQAVCGNQKEKRWSQEKPGGSQETKWSNAKTSWWGYAESQRAWRVYPRVGEETNFFLLFDLSLIVLF